MQARIPLLLAAAAAAAVLVVAPEIPLLAFATILVGVFLDALTTPLEARLRLPRWAALTMVMALLLVAVAVVGVVVASRLARDLDQVGDALPRLFARAAAALEAHAWGRALLRSALSSAADDGARLAAAVVRAPVAILTGGVVVAIGGLFLAATPGLYLGALLALFPLERRGRAEEILREMGSALAWFLLGRAVSMLFVALLTWLVLAWLDVPLALPVGIAVGVVTFVPYLGPLVGTLPVAVVALGETTSTLVWAVAAYAVIQWAEGFVLAPLVQERLVSLPPAVTLFSQVAFGFLFGPLGVALAVPAAAVGQVAVRRHWIPRVSGPAPPLP